MRSLAILVLVLAAGAASAQYPEDCRNGVGLFTVATVPPGDMFAHVTYTGPPGQFTVHGILFNPHDDNTDRDLVRVGGYELRLALPGHVFLLETFLPAGAANRGGDGDFLVTMDAPVVADQCGLFTLTLGAFVMTEGFITLVPPAAGGSLPGLMAVLGTGPESGPSPAYPVSGDAGAPVFAVWPYGGAVKSSYAPGCDSSVPARATTFGTMKALYR